MEGAVKKLIIEAMRITSPQRPITSLQVMAAFGVERGMTLRECLAGTGLRPEALEDPATTVAIEQEFALIRNLLRHLGDTPGLGLEVARRLHFTSLGSVGFAVASCSSLHQAFEVALRYIDLTYALTAFRFEEEGDECRIVLDDGAVPRDLHRFALERAVGVLHTQSAMLFGRQRIGRYLQFSFAAPADPGIYERLLGVAPAFDAPRTVIGIDAEEMKRPLAQGSALALQQAEEQCRRLLAERRARSGLAQRVCDRLARLGGRPPQMNEMAAALCLSARTLRRRLQEEGTTYFALCDEVRRTFAEQLLALPHLTVEAVAERLGYSEAAGFIHAFRRWTGMTPRAFRVAGRENPVSAEADRHQ